jgi:Acetyltransferases
VSIEIRKLSIPEFNINVPTLVDIYIRAMEYDPEIRQARISVWRRNSLNPGFTAVCGMSHGNVVSIAYGFSGSPDHWWRRQLLRGLLLQGDPNTGNQDPLRDYFEVAEVHVLSSHQGLGIGRLMMTELLRDVTAAHAILSTPEVDHENNRAFGLYRSLGFTDLLRHFTFDGDEREFAVLSSPLPLIPEASRSSRWSS